MTKKGNFIICNCCDEKVAEFLSEEQTEKDSRIIKGYVKIPWYAGIEGEHSHLCINCYLRVQSIVEQEKSKNFTKRH